VSRVSVGVAEPDLVPPVLPSHEDPVARGASQLVGGPVGRHARVGRWHWAWTPLRVLVALTIMTCALGWVQKAQCRDIRLWSHNGAVYQYTRYCYSDIVALYGAEGLAQHEVPYVDHAVEYPVLIGAVMGVAGWASTAADDDGPGAANVHSTALFYDVTVLLLAVATVVAVVCTGLSAGRRRIWDAALLALAPTLVLHLATNWDMLAVALASGALLAWGRRRPALAGVLIGLGAATKLYPAIFLVPLLLLCLRTGQLRAWLRAALAGVVAFVVVTLPVYLVSPAYSELADGSTKISGQSAWQALSGGYGGSAIGHALLPFRDGGENGVLRFWHLNRTRGADIDSLWLLADHVKGATVGGGGLFAGDAQAGHLNLAVAGVYLIMLAGIAALALLAPRRPRLPQLLFLTLAGFLLANKVYSPQYTLWLAPLAVLARPRWRGFLLWQLSEALVLLTRFPYFILLHIQDQNASHGAKLPERGLQYPWFGAAVALRDLVLLGLCAAVVREALVPAADVVRADGWLDDRAGGVLDGADDAWRGDADARRGHADAWRGHADAWRGDADAWRGDGPPARHPDEGA